MTRSDSTCVKKHDTVKDFSSRSSNYFCKSASRLKPVTDMLTSCQKTLKGGLSTVSQINNSPKHGVFFHPFIRK